MSLQTLSDLPLVKNFTTPITAATKDFYLDTLAKGSGPNGLLLIQDFFGGSTGPAATSSLITVNTILRQQLANGNLTNLAAIYANLVGGLDGRWVDPETGFILVPSGPGAGLYTSKQDLVVTFVGLARSAIDTAAVAMGSATATLNSAFSEPAAGTVAEQELQLAAGIDFADLTEGAQTPVLALVLSVPTLGTDDASGRPAQFFESVIDKTTVAGQALVGALREGQNSQLLNDAGVNGYNIIPAR
jgi:hypothetical protein